MKTTINNNQMKKYLNLLMILFIAPLFLFWSCDEAKDFNDPKDDVPPGKVTNIRVKNVSGGAWIYYNLPTDNDLLGVKALMSFGEEPREAFSSKFNDSILIEGAPGTEEYIVNLHTVDKSGNMSTPELVTIKPLTPPVDYVRQTLKINNTFGGVFLNWDNEYGEDIAITIYIVNEEGEWEWYDAYHSNTKVGKCIFRGLEAIEQPVRVEIRDKWMNFAETMEAIVEPLYEEEIIGMNPVSNQPIWKLFGLEDRTCLYRGDIQDSRNLNGGNNFPKAFDGIYTNNWWMCEESRIGNYIPDPDNQMMYPFYFIIDMGRNASYSRFTYWIRDRGPLMSAPSPDVFELWATNHVKAPSEVGDGSQADNLKYWTSWPEVGGTDEWKKDWVKIADCVIRFPSGLNGIDGAYGSMTAEDQAFFRAGFDFEIDPEYAFQSFRYIRWVTQKCTTPQNMVQVAELKFYGQYAD
ncbi:hypothetical protein FACS1894155_02770 [Bacteroidia bacterium]|nr:hypothetical protein FACS1894155_02770 [Bacteroidia bacterium]